jgi:alkanesulfonate monooxygenase SsuD/methylene tetrahydromethanopterin reductase-like flavin-dependent oxidoreductase (luciferase family)
MIRAAAEESDGLLGHPFTSPRFLAEVVRPQVEERLAEAGRSRDAFTVAQGVIVSIGEDRDAARQAARQQVAFYGTTPNYRAVFEANGDAYLTDRLRSAWATSSGDPAALAQLLPDEVLDRYAVAGEADEVRERLGTFSQHVDHVILGSPWFGLSPARMVENTAAILATFGRSSDG